MPRKFQLHESKGGSAIAIRITPRASRNEISEILPDGTIKVRLTAPPVDGQANHALIRFLAGVLDVAPTRIEIIAGQTGRNKLITIQDLEPTVVQQRILGYLS